MRAVRFDHHGEQGDVLRLEDAGFPEAKAGHMRIKVHVCGRNPVDWALCRDVFAGDLCRGYGLDVSETVDAIDEGVVDLAVGEQVLGVPVYQDYLSAGAAEAFAGQLHALSAEVTNHSDSMVEQVRKLAGGAPDLILDADPISDVLPSLVSIADAWHHSSLVGFAYADSNLCSEPKGLAPSDQDSDRLP